MMAVRGKEKAICGYVSFRFSTACGKTGGKSKNAL